MKKLPQSVLITAGTKRIGFYLAKATLAMGYNAILHYRSSDHAARRWVQRNPRFREKVFFIRHDLNDSPEIVIERALEFPCTLVGLVNNASSFLPGNCADSRHLQEMLNIHLLVPARLGAAFH